MWHIWLPISDSPQITTRFHLFAFFFRISCRNLILIKHAVISNLNLSSGLSVWTLYNSTSDHYQCCNMLSQGKTWQTILVLQAYFPLPRTFTFELLPVFSKELQRAWTHHISSSRAFSYIRVQPHSSHSL